MGQLSRTMCYLGAAALLASLAAEPAVAANAMDTFSLNFQSAPAGTALPGSITPAIIIKDGGGNPVAGVSVTFAVTGGGGSITGAVQNTNAAGVATLGSWTLGVAPGTNTLTATSAGVTNSPLTFIATGTGPPVKLEVFAGDNQSTFVNRNVTAPCAIVKDALGAGISGITVTFAIGSGGGIVTDPVQPTNSLGIAIVGGWRLGGEIGKQTLTATSGALGTITFNATANPDFGAVTGPFANPGFAFVAQPVSFTCGSNLVAPSYGWNFGDGTPGAAGDSVQHTYAAPGTYTVTATATNSTQTASGSLLLPVYHPIELNLARKFVKAASPSAGRDMAQFDGTLTLPPGVTALPDSAFITFGTFSESFLLTKGSAKVGGSSASFRGKTKNGALTSQELKFKIKLGGNMLKVLADAGLSGSSGTVTIPLQLVLGRINGVATKLTFTVTGNGKTLQGK